MTWHGYCFGVEASFRKSWFALGFLNPKSSCKIIERISNQNGKVQSQREASRINNQNKLYMLASMMRHQITKTHLLKFGLVGAWGVRRGRIRW